jgi:O-antigen biosynthesis protein WbqV
MSIPEAVALVIQAATLAAADRPGGEILTLDMGTSVNIADLAHRLIRLHGLRPDVDIPIKMIGARPGERMHEELFCSLACETELRKQPTSIPGVFGACNACAPEYHELALGVERLKRLAAGQRNGQLSEGIGAVLRLQKQINPPAPSSF